MKKQPLIWAALRVFRFLCSIFPHRAAIAIGGWLGLAVKKFSPARVDRARARCSRILGVSSEEAEQIVSESYSHFGRALVEFIRMPQMIGKLEELISLEGEEHLREAFARGKGVILLSAHIGNWEYAAALLASRGFPLYAIGAEQRDYRITNAIEELRRSAGVKPLGKGFDLKGALSCLKKGEGLCILLDQDAKEMGIVSPFLGFPASTPVGPLKMARKFGSAVVPAHLIRDADGVHMTLVIEPALEGRDGEPFGEDVQYSADLCNEVISGWIRRNPGQWMWIYPRWATTLNDR